MTGLFPIHSHVWHAHKSFSLAYTKAVKNASNQQMQFLTCMRWLNLSQMMDIPKAPYVGFFSNADPVLTAVPYAGFSFNVGPVLITVPYAWFSCTSGADSAYSFVLRLHKTITAIKTTPRITAITAPTATPANTPTDNWSLLPDDELLLSVGSVTGVGVSTDADMLVAAPLLAEVAVVATIIVAVSGGCFVAAELMDSDSTTVAAEDTIGGIE